MTAKLITVNRALSARLENVALRYREYVAALADTPEADSAAVAKWRQIAADIEEAAKIVGPPVY